MKIITAFLILFSAIFIFSSCTKVTKVELEVVCFDRLSETGNYPKDIKDIVLPLKNDCSKSGIAFVPFSIKRQDLSYKITIEYLLNKSVEYNKYNPIERDCNKFFNDSLLSNKLNTPKNSAYDVANYLSTLTSKENCFIFSSDENLQVGTTPIYRSITELKDAISKAICEKKLTKVTVLYEPTNLSQMPLVDVTDTDTPITPSSNSNTEELRNWLLKIADTKATPSERRNIADKLYRDVLSENFYARIYRDSPASEPTYYPKGSGKAYLDNLTTEESITDFTNIKVTRSNEKNKIDYIELVEKHNQ